ncbi:hypothetical protein CASFOL_021063 [Castilleja foliolosa]|uniref:VQ domain-containing protein n=1 Tax=Castilleja foliolosa TaxID=1961234 RepID=A0ABD3CY47_9LAMI
MDEEGLGNESSSIYSSSSAPITNNSSTDMFLKQLNKNSLKIAKPIRKPIPFPNPTTAAPPPTIPVIDSNPHNPPQSQQPPVYNINKNDFRDVVQKLTGSPAHERLPTPPTAAVTHPRPPSSRLQRIRPPPLAQISNHPTQITQILPHSQYDAGHRPSAHAPPLPPLPSVHAAAESPISSYMRFLKNPPQNEFGQRPPLPFSPLQPMNSPVSAYLRFFQNPAGSSSAPPQAPTQLPTASTAPLPAMPLSPLPFGCIPSPRSPYGMMARGFPFSPTAQLGLPQQLPPLSPTPTVPSPR